MATIHWLKGISGQWTTGADWSGGAVPGASDDVTIAVSSGTLPYTITLGTSEKINSLRLAQKAATLLLSQSTLTVAGNVALSSGRLELSSGSLIGGGNFGSQTNIVTAGAAVTVLLDSTTESTIKNLVWHGDLNLAVATSGPGSFPRAAIYLNGVTFAGADGTGQGVLSVGTDVALNLAGNQDFSNVKVSLGSGASLGSDSGSLTVAADASLTFHDGATANLNVVDNSGLISVSGAAALSNIVSGGIFGNTSFSNTGTVSVSKGAAAFISALNDSNSGLITVASGGYLQIGAGASTTFSNSGSLAIAGTLSLNETLTTAQLAAFGISSGTVAIADTLTNTGAILSDGSGAGAAAAHLSLQGGTIVGGTIINNGGLVVSNAPAFGPGPTAGTLTGVTFEGTLAVQQAAALTIDGGFTLTGISQGTNGAIALADMAQLNIVGDTTLDHLTITAGGPDDGGGLFAGAYFQSGATTLTLGAHSVFRQVGAYANLSGIYVADAVINKGVIMLDYAGGMLGAGCLTNLGHIAIANGASLDDITSNAGTIVASGDATVAGSRTLGAPNPGFINSGVILASQAGGTLTLAGSLDNTGTIAVAGGTLALEASTFSNTGTISVSGGILLTGSIAASQLETIALSQTQVDVTGNLAIDTAAPLRVGTGTALGSIRLSGDVSGGTIIDSGQGIIFYGAASLLGVTYQGTLNITRPLTSLTIAEGFSATSGPNGTAPGIVNLTGAGSTMTVASGETFDNATLTIGNATLSYGAHAVFAPSLLTQGYSGENVDLGAALVIQQSGTYATIGGALADATSAASYSSGLGAIASAATIHANIAHGQLSLEGASFTTTGIIAVSNTDTVTEGATAFTNGGAITIGAASTFAIDTYNYFASGTFADTAFINAGSIALSGGTLTELTGGGAFPPVAILNNGTIRGAGLLDGRVDNAGAIIATGGTLMVDQAISGTGSLVVGTGATLDLTNAVGSGQRVTFGGASGVLGLAPAMYHAKLAHFVTGDAIDLTKTAATSAAFSGNAIIVTLSGGGTISLGTTSALSGSLATTSDGHGGTLVEFAGSHAALAPVQTPVPAAGPAWANVHLPDAVQAAWSGPGHVHLQQA